MADAQAGLAPLWRVLRLDVVGKAVEWLPDHFLCCGFALMAGASLRNFNPKHVVAPELADGALRVVLQEYHHALRRDGPGYGATLGGALVLRVWGVLHRMGRVAGLRHGLKRSWKN
ncbi:hypothetical protein [Thioclava sp. GXIMD2076]|uniref:DUF4157 domain-containing protein n=1 Tax=Thioclava kandeliae TaxID=3070818 RepID=A0ABV1SJK6_9RHOB